MKNFDLLEPDPACFASLWCFDDVLVTWVPVTRNFGKRLAAADYLL